MENEDVVENEGGSVSNEKSMNGTTDARHRPQYVQYTFAQGPKQVHGLKLTIPSIMTLFDAAKRVGRPLNGKYLSDVSFLLILAKRNGSVCAYGAIFQTPISLTRPRI